MKKIDYKKVLKDIYHPSSKDVQIVDVPAMNFLMVDGQGNPNTSPEFQDAIAVLYPLSYTLKFMMKRSQQFDYGVLPLEGLWWADDMSAFSVEDKDAWEWTLMIMQPPCITEAMTQEAMTQIKEKKNPASLSKVRFQTFREGPAAQIMHIGPFTEEGPTVEKVHVFIEQTGHLRRGKHHEIYLSDIRRAAPANWKTIIRQPIAPLAS